MDDIQYKAPNGDAIQGVSDMTPGAAGVTFDAGEECGFDYSGGTSMFWDGSKTETICGAVLFIDESGNEWQQHHLIPEDAERLSQDVIDAMASEDFLGQAIDAAKKLGDAIDTLVKNGLYRASPSPRWLLNDLEPLHAEAKKKVAEMMAAELEGQKFLAAVEGRA